MVQADSFIKIFIQSQPVEQTCPCCGAKTKRIHDYRLQEVQDIPFTGKTSNPASSQTPLPLPILPQTVHGTLFVPPQLPPQDPQAGILHCLPAPADLFLKTDRRALPVFPSRRSAAFWTRFAILRLTSFHKRFPLTNSKAMLLPVNISAFCLIRKRRILDIPPRSDPEPSG